MKIFFYLGHPAQFHFYKNIIRKFKETGDDVSIFIKTKDILESLLKQTGWTYKNIVPNRRGVSKAAIFFSLMKRDYIIAKEILKDRPDLLISSDTSFSHNGFIFRIPCLCFMDDDFDAVGYYSRITYPFTTTVIAPDVVKMGKWDRKRVSFKGYLKLGYLHPNWFKSDQSKIGELAGQNYCLIRLSELRAHHDSDKKGVNKKLLSDIIEKVSPKAKIVISVEGKLDQEFERYRLTIPVHDIHHFLSFATILISDSQSMSGEAAMLGVPSIRISSFAGKLSVLEELEQIYELTFGFNPDNEEKIINKIDDLMAMPDLINVFKQRRQKMLDDKIDVTAFSIWFCQNYPESVNILKNNPDYQYIFK